MAIIRRSLNEIRESRPRLDRKRFRAASGERRLVATMAADPDLAPDMANVPLPPEPRAIRTAAGLTQEQFAALLGIPVATLRNWEQERHRPEPGAAALFRLMARDLQHALKVLAG